MNKIFKYYRRKSSEIQAYQFLGDEKGLREFCGDALIALKNTFGNIYAVKTEIGDITINYGYYVTKNYQGEFGVYTQDVFECKYEPVTDETSEK